MAVLRSVRPSLIDRFTPPASFTASPHAILFHAVYLGDATHEASQARPVIAPRLVVGKTAGAFRGVSLVVYRVTFTTFHTFLLRDLAPSEANMPAPMGFIYFIGPSGQVAVRFLSVLRVAEDLRGQLGLRPSGFVQLRPGPEDPSGGGPLYYVAKAVFSIPFHGPNPPPVSEIEYVGDPFYPPTVWIPD